MPIRLGKLEQLVRHWLDHIHNSNHNILRAQKQLHFCPSESDKSLAQPGKLDAELPLKHKFELVHTDTGDDKLIRLDNNNNDNNKRRLI